MFCNRKIGGLAWLPPRDAQGHWHYTLPYRYSKSRGKIRGKGTALWKPTHKITTCPEIQNTDTHTPYQLDDKMETQGAAILLLDVFY